MKRPILLEGLFSAVLAIGCGDPLSVEELAGTYQLTAMDARSLPQLLSATVECDEWVQVGNLTLQPSGEFMLVVQGELDCTRGGGQVQMIGWEYPGSYSVVGRTLQFVSPLFPSGELHFTGTVELLNTRILVTDLDLHSSNATDLEFRR